ncbi:hypothetical protein JYU34_014515 [Plutella xylostella]|uniref:Caseinolytic peptidase B-like protein n=1 Tax=Plutella xylostella TaxID=51655 RepID=A0ABQ7Q9Z5_PLUXY|nr:hypothetical protein JYU34_014515 [Plutella xylostella]
MSSRSWLAGVAWRAARRGLVVRAAASVRQLRASSGGPGAEEAAPGYGHWAAAAALAVTVIAAEHYNEKRFFKAALLGNVQELEKQIQSLETVVGGGGSGGGGEEEGSAADRRHTLGWTALMAAAANNQAPCVRALLARGARPDARDRYPGAAAAAARHGLHALDILQRREEEFCPSMNARASYLGWTALHYAALGDSADSTRALLAGGADPTARDHAGRRAIHYARDASPTRELLVEAAKDWERAAAAAAAEERRRYPLEQRLKRFLVGQRAAINAVAAAVRRKENGWSDEDHPLVFLFLGSSGVGKTELGKQLARYLHGDQPGAFIRLDMSEYGERHEVAKLIGAPPGYVGHESGGLLTRALQKRPDAVVLLDEVDKAHPDVLTVLLQLFDEGRLTDGKGKLIECKDAVFVMTSNLAADEIAQYGMQLRREAERPPAGPAPTVAAPDAPAVAAPDDQPAPEVQVSRQFKDQVVRPILKRHFGRDEFLGRINEMVYFLPFSRAELLELVQLELGRWAERARARHGIDLAWEGGVLGALADGYDVHYGARSIQHEVERRVVNRLAAAAERGELPRGAGVRLEARGGRLALAVRRPPDGNYKPLDAE